MTEDNCTNTPPLPPEHWATMGYILPMVSGLVPDPRPYLTPVFLNPDFWGLLDGAQFCSLPAPPHLTQFNVAYAPCIWHFEMGVHFQLISALKIYRTISIILVLKRFIFVHILKYLKISFLPRQFPAYYLPALNIIITTLIPINQTDNFRSAFLKCLFYFSLNRQTALYSTACGLLRFLT